jgi:acyl carrier protein
LTPQEIHGRLTEIFKDVLDLPSVSLTRDTTAAEIEEWDSLNHISLIVAIERDFSVRFDLAELKSLRNVGDMLDLIQRKATLP